MATATFNASATSETDTYYRTWGGGLSDALAAVGMVQTADTGQIDWETATAPTSSGEAGYEVWRFDDALQATTPLFFRLGYGSNGSDGTPVHLWLTVGKGSDGSGGITGVLMSATMVGQAATSTFYTSTAVEPCYVSSCPQGSCVAVMLFSGTERTYPVVQPGFVIERSRDTDGAPTSEGVMIAWETGPRTSQTHVGGSNAVRVVNYDSGVYNQGAPPVIAPSTINGAAISAASSLTQPIAPIFPWILFTPGLSPWQSLAAMSYMGGDASPGPTTVHVRGEDRTYRVVPSILHHGWGVAPALNFTASGSPTNSHAIGIALLWEN